MFYQLAFSISVKSSLEAERVRSQLQALLEKESANIQTPDKQTYDFILSQYCYHDEDPPKPCEEIEFEVLSPARKLVSVRHQTQ